MAATVPGGFTETANATKDIQHICDEVKHSVEAKINKKYVHFKATKYRKQTVKGTNYLIKIDVGGDHYIHVKVLQKLPCDGGKVELTSWQENHKKDDALAPF